MEMRKYVVQAYEEECGTDVFVISSDKTEEETMTIIRMAAKYARVCDDYDIEEGIIKYDEYYETIINNSECGLSKFQQYIELKGLKIEPIIYDYAFEW